MHVSGDLSWLAILYVAQKCSCANALDRYKPHKGIPPCVAADHSWCLDFWAQMERLIFVRGIMCWEYRVWCHIRARVLTNRNTSTLKATSLNTFSCEQTFQKSHFIRLEDITSLCCYQHVRHLWEWLRGREGVCHYYTLSLVNFQTNITRIRDIPDNGRILLECMANYDLEWVI